MNKLKFIQLGFVSLLIFGLFMVSIPFITSLNPTQATILSSQVTVDVSKIKTGDPVKVDTLYGEVWIIKRSKAEIDELAKDFPEPLLYENMEQKLPIGVKKETRSIKSNLFVFRVDRMDKVIYLSENPFSLHPCDNFVRLHGDVQIDSKKTINGGFACKSQFGYHLNYENSGFIYDLAGRSISRYVSPLRIPNYFYKNNTQLVIGSNVKG